MNKQVLSVFIYGYEYQGNNGELLAWQLTLLATDLVGSCCDLTYHRRMELAQYLFYRICLGSLIDDWLPLSDSMPPANAIAGRCVAIEHFIVPLTRFPGLLCC
jgi:hypothetical protein